MFNAFYQNYRQRKEAYYRRHEVMRSAEKVPVAYIYLHLFILPLLINPAILFDLSSWLWWVKVSTPLFALVTGLLYTGVFGPLFLSFFSSASIEAMTQTAPDEPPIPFAAQQVKVPCALPSQQLAPALAVERDQTEAYLRHLGRHLARRSSLARSLLYPVQRFTPLPTHIKEPSA